MTLLCGGNIDTTVLGRCLERGLAADGRLVKFSVTVSDRPGGIAELAKTLTQCGVSIKDMMHERAWIKSDIFAVTVSHEQDSVLSFYSTSFACSCICIGSIGTLVKYIVLNYIHCIRLKYRSIDFESNLK